MNVNPPFKGCDERNERCEKFANKRQRKLSAWLRKMREACGSARQPSQLRLVQVLRERQKVKESPVTGKDKYKKFHSTLPHPPPSDHRKS